VLIRICSSVEMFVGEWLVILIDVHIPFDTSFLRSFGIHLGLLLRVLWAILLLEFKTGRLGVVAGRFRNVSIWISVV